MEKLTKILAVIPEGGVKSPLFDKVLRLARDCGARVELFLVAPSDYFATAGRCAALEYPAAVAITLHDAVTPLADAVFRRAQAVRADLLVASRDFPRVNECPIPLLLLGDAPWAEEPRFAAAVDVANEDCEALTRGILHTAGFLAQRFTAHLDILYSEREPDDQRLRMERAVRLARLVREYHVGCERLQVFDGQPEHRLPALIGERRYDLLAVGYAPRQGPLAAFHSVSRRLMAATAGDLLLVPPVPARESPSAREQLVHEA